MAKHTFTAEPNSLDIVSTYVFDAPRERVFEAFTDPKLIPKWWGVDELTVDEMDVKTGGSWQFTMGPAGQKLQFRGVYHEVTAPERVVATWQYQGMPSVILQSVIFEEQPGGKTKVTEQMVFQSLSERESLMSTGMDEGSVPMMERLEKLL